MIAPPNGRKCFGLPNLQVVREAAGLTQQQLADLIEVEHPPSCSEDASIILKVIISQIDAGIGVGNAESGALSRIVSFLAN